jgi:hypothetical protein
MRKGTHKRIGTTSLVLLSLLIAVCTFSVTIYAAPLPDVDALQTIQKQKVVFSHPDRIAVGADGMIYVVDGGKNRVLVMDRKGNHVANVYIKGACALDVAPNGILYVGSEKDNSVAIVEDRSVSGHLGNGAGEFLTVRDIAVDGSTGNVYVADSIGNVVKVYDANGNKIREITNLNLPSGVDVKGGEVYILDSPEIPDPMSTSTMTTSGRVSVYDSNGTFLRSFMDSIHQDGVMYSPKDITVADDGTIYISDAYYKAALAFDNTGTYLGEVVHPTETIDTAVSLATAPDARLLITSSNTSSILTFGPNGYTWLEAVPPSLSFTAQTGMPNPPAQTATVSNAGSGDLAYTTATSDAWIQTDSPSGTVLARSSQDMNVSVDAAGMSTGSYTGSLTIADDSGASEVVAVTLNVLPPAALSVDPQTMTFDAGCGSGNPASQTATIEVLNDVNGSITWTAEADQSWLSINPGSGSGGAIPASVSVDTTGLPDGSHPGVITVTAPGADNSPAAINVTLNVTVMGALAVTANIPEASYTINGPSSSVYNGSGTSWSQDCVADGDYTITYSDVAGFRTPASETLTVANGNTAGFSGSYLDLRQEVNIIASHGPGNKEPSDVSIFTADGTTPEFTFTPFTYNYGASTAVGDVDGDGELEIIVGVGPGSKVPAEVKGFEKDGSPIAGLDFLAHDTKFGVVVAAGDFDGNGRAEIITGQGRTSSEVRVVTFESGSVTDTGVSFIAYSNAVKGVRVAAADLDGDDVPELITAPQSSTAAPVVNIYSVDTSSGMGSWTAQLVGSIQACDDNSGTNIATGDVDADGTSEVMVVCPSSVTEVRVFTMDGTPVASFATGSNKQDFIAAGDTNNDGKAEIIVGAGPEKNNTTVTIYDAQGNTIRSFDAFTSSYGVRITTGNLGLGGAQ